MLRRLCIFPMFVQTTLHLPDEHRMPDSVSCLMHLSLIRLQNTSKLSKWLNFEILDSHVIPCDILPKVLCLQTAKTFITRDATKVDPRSNSYRYTAGWARRSYEHRYWTSWFWVDLETMRMPVGTVSTCTYQQSNKTQFGQRMVGRCWCWRPSVAPGARPGPMPGARFQTPHFTLSEVGMKDISSWTLQLESLSNFPIIMKWNISYHVHYQNIERNEKQLL